MLDLFFAALFIIFHFMCLSITGYYVLKITGTFGLLHDPIDYRHTKYVFFVNKFFMLRRHLKKDILQSFLVVITLSAMVSQIIDIFKKGVLYYAF